MLLFTLIYGLPKPVLADSSNFSPALFIHGGITNSSFNQKALNNKSYPYLDLEYQVSPSLSAVLHTSRINAYTNNMLIPYMIYYASKPGTTIPDTLYNIEEKERLIINCYTLKFKFKLSHNNNHFAYLSPQMGFMFANSTKNRRSVTINQTYKSMETFYTYGFDFGTEHKISSDGKLRLCTGIGLLIGNMETKDEYNYTSILKTRLVTYNLFAGLKYMLFANSAN